MKITRKIAFALAACTLSFASTLHAQQVAQQAAVHGGTLGVSLNASLVNPLGNVGVGLTVSPYQQYQNGYPVFAITGGVVDQAAGTAEIGTEGGFVFQNSTLYYQFRRLAIDTTGSIPLLTGVLYVNGVNLGRQPLFDILVNQPLGKAIPLGSLSTGALYCRLHQSMRDRINYEFHVNIQGGGVDAVIFIDTTLTKDTGPQ